jgi:hypothetical protein
VEATTVNVVERAYELEATRLRAGVRTLSWRMSADVRDGFVQRADGAIGSSPTEFILLGYPARVDRTLPLNSLICDGAPEVAP